MRFAVASAQIAHRPLHLGAKPPGGDVRSVCADGGRRVILDLLVRASGVLEVADEPPDPGIARSRGSTIDRVAVDGPID